MTSLDPDYPLIRFATGALSTAREGSVPCRRANLRINAGRADQVTREKDIFLCAEQVAAFARRHAEIRVERVARLPNDGRVIEGRRDRG